MEERRAGAKARDELAAYNVPLIMVIALMPFLSGFITGIAVGFVGLSFPLAPCECIILLINVRVLVY